MQAVIACRFEVGRVFVIGVCNECMIDLLWVRRREVKRPIPKSMAIYIAIASDNVAARRLQVIFMYAYILYYSGKEERPWPIARG